MLHICAHGELIYGCQKVTVSHYVSVPNLGPLQDQPVLLSIDLYLQIAGYFKQRSWRLCASTLHVFFF